MSPNARERAYEKRRYEEWQAKLAQRKAARRRAQRTSLIIVASVLVVLVIGGTFFLVAKNHGSDASTAASSPSPSTSAAATAAPTQAPGGCKPSTLGSVANPKQYKSVPAKTIAANKTWTWTLTTTCGTVVISLDGAKAPQAVSSTIFLTQNGYYDKSPCPRLTASPASSSSTALYVLQCGAPSGTTSDTPGYSYGPLENLPANGTYKAGDVAMARGSDANSQGSQFFIVYQDSSLPDQTTGKGGYTIIGHVTSGLDVITKLAKTGENGQADGSDGAPNTPFSIISAKVAAG